MDKFNIFAFELQKAYPFKIKYKNESDFMKFLGWILFFNKKFMTSYTTTIGNTIYFPSKEYIENDELSSIIVLGHEIVHLDQSRRYGSVAYSLMYLFPQCLALLSLFSFLAFYSLWFLLCLLFLLFLAPIPAYWRKNFELEAYKITLYMDSFRMKCFGYTDGMRDYETISYATNISNKEFRGPMYWYMWPWGVFREFYDVTDEIHNSTLHYGSEVYTTINSALELCFGKQ